MDWLGHGFERGFAAYLIFQTLAGGFFAGVETPASYRFASSHSLIMRLFPRERGTAGKNGKPIRLIEQRAKS